MDIITTADPTPHITPSAILRLISQTLGRQSRPFWACSRRSPSVAISTGTVKVSVQGYQNPEITRRDNAPPPRK